LTVISPVNFNLFSAVRTCWRDNPVREAIFSADVICCPHETSIPRHLAGLWFTDNSKQMNTLNVVGSANHSHESNRLCSFIHPARKPPPILLNF
jgi:hypothetical protein